MSVAQVRELLRAAEGEALASLLHELRMDSRAGVRAAVAASTARLRAQDTETARIAELYRFESDLRLQGAAAVAGVDEVGRGALAGPLTVGACVLPSHPPISDLDDSKRLSPAKREDVARRIRESAVACAVAHVPPADVDRMGVSRALAAAMRSAVDALGISPEHVIIDGRPLRIFENEIAVVGGDRRVAAVAAASVIAKVERDRLMTELALYHPEYGFAVNKGYGTAEHLAAIDRLGPSPAHRVTFCHPRGETLF